MAATLAMFAVVTEAARADAPPAGAKTDAAAKPAAPAPAAPKPPPSKPPPPKPQAKTTVEPVDKDQVVAILGRTVTGPKGQEVGRLTDVLVDGTGQPQAAVLDIGGFMGVGMRSIAVHWSALHFTPSNPKAPITLSLSLDEIKAAPEYKGLENKPAPVVAPVPAKPVPAH